MFIEVAFSRMIRVDYLDATVLDRIPSGNPDRRTRVRREML
jgi:hypothetical protein